MRERKEEKPVFDIDDRGFNAKAWYAKDIEGSKGDAIIHVSYNGELLRNFIYPAYKMFNIAAHFSDIVDGELSKDGKARGYKIAGSNGLGGGVIPVPNN